jgi:branched-chain amino acid transport system substrate-binding protein
VSIRSGKYAAAVALTSALVLSACGSSGGGSSSTASGSSSAGSGTPIEWGVNAELSGPLSSYGSTIAGGVKAYVDQVNASGGINGSKINLTQLDSAGDQARSAANATQLATANKVIAMFGNTLSTDCAAAQPVAERYKVPQACLSVAQGSTYTFSLGPDNGRAASAMLEGAKKVVGKSSGIKAAMFMLTTLTDQQLKKDIQAKASSAGVTIATAQDADVTAADVSAQVAQIVASKPDVILASTTGPGFVTVLKGVRAAGVQAPFVWLDGTGNLKSLATINDPGVYAFTVHQIVDPSSAKGAAKDYVAAVTPVIQGTPDQATLNSGEYITGYATARAFGEATKKCGDNCTGAKLQQQLQKTSIALEDLVPTYAYAGSDHYPYANWLLQQVQGTTYKQVASFKADAAK